MKEAKLMKWFRVLQDSNIIKGRVGQHEEVVEDYYFLKVLSAETSLIGGFLFRIPTSFL